MLPEPLHVCMNGHVVQNDEYIERTPRCLQCGDPIVSSCQSCGKPLPIPDEFDIHPSPPVHCGHCGDKHEWTRRKMQAAIELFVEDAGTTSDEAKSFEAEIDHISRDTPQAQLSAIRINKLLGKVAAGTGNLIRDMTIGIASSVIANTLSNK